MNQMISDEPNRRAFDDKMQRIHLIRWIDAVLTTIHFVLSQLNSVHIEHMLLAKSQS